jgi:hypothetical protein
VWSTESLKWNEVQKHFKYKACVSVHFLWLHAIELSGGGDHASWVLNMTTLHQVPCQFRTPARLKLGVPLLAAVCKKSYVLLMQCVMFLEPWHRKSNIWTYQVRQRDLFFWCRVCLYLQKASVERQPTQDFEHILLICKSSLSSSTCYTFLLGGIKFGSCHFIFRHQSKFHQDYIKLKMRKNLILWIEKLPMRSKFNIPW